MQSEKMVIAGTLSYISVLAFFTCYVFIPSNTFLLITIITLGLIPNSYYWYNRTTKGERRKEALILAVLILAGMMYYLTRIF